MTTPVQTLTQPRRFGRFWWLWLIGYFLALQIPIHLFGTRGLGVLWSILLGACLSISVVVLHELAQRWDRQYSSSLNHPSLWQNAWPWSAKLLAGLVLIETLGALALFTYEFSPCGSLDIIRRLQGCVTRIEAGIFFGSLSLSADGQHLATSGPGQQTKVWTLPSATPIDVRTTLPADIYDVALSPDGTLLVTSQLEGEVVVWRLSDQMRLHIGDPTKGQWPGGLLIRWGVGDGNGPGCGSTVGC